MSEKNPSAGFVAGISYQKEFPAAQQPALKIY
jgi:hypothetical protein